MSCSGGSQLPEKLATATRDLLADPSNRIFVGVASIREMAIKTASGRLAMPDRLMESRAAFRVAILLVEVEHAFAAAILPHIHRDPFDRMIVARAMQEGRTIVIRDPLVIAYPVATLLA